jgi:hypothetical protein
VIHAGFSKALGAATDIGVGTHVGTGALVQKDIVISTTAVASQICAIFNVINRGK